MSGARMKKPEVLARKLVHDIAEGGYREGDLLPPEATMVDTYDVGRATLREALRLLESQGLVSMRRGQGGGPVVGTANPEHLSRISSLYFSFEGCTYGELGEAMLVVDPWLAELAAGGPDRERVHAAMAPFLGHRHLGEPDAVRSLHFRDLHHAIRRIPHNRVLSLWGQVIGLLFDNHIVREIDFSPMHEEVADAHVALARAIDAGTARKARQLMMDHTQDIVDFCQKTRPGFAGQQIEWR
jgi:DNA-binding FadR family transcriptional regulator